MKRMIERNFLPIFVLGLLSACSSDDASTERTDTNTKVIYATAYRQTPSLSRTAYEDFYGQSTEMKVKWAAGDAFAVIKSGFSGSMTGTDLPKFTIKEQADEYTNVADFECTETEKLTTTMGVVSGDVLNAIYPASALNSVTSAINQKRVELNFATQEQTGDTPANLGRYDVMIGHGTYDESNTVAFDFSDNAAATAGYVCCIMRFDLDFGTTYGVTKVNKLVLSMDKDGTEKLNTHALVNMDGKTTLIYDTPGTYTVNVSDGQPDADGHFPVWMAVMPSDFVGTCHYSVYTDKGLFRLDKEYNYGVLARGNRNKLALDLSGVHPIVNVNGNGGTEDMTDNNDTRWDNPKAGAGTEDMTGNNDTRWDTPKAGTGTQQMIGSNDNNWNN